MAVSFFRSIPGATIVKDSYEEVFSLFTTETTDTLWAHNRSVSQQSTKLELELDFTPAPSPAASQPGSRPDSRGGSYFPADTASSDALANGMGLEKDSFSTSSPPLSTPTGSIAPGSPALGSGGSLASLPKAKSPATRALLGNRKTSRHGGSGSAVALASPQSNKKPVVIHQSLSTLSQPGQTGSVVWDSSILMAKFMLSIKGLTMGCYKAQLRERRAQEARNRQLRRTQQHQIRNLEEQAEHLAVSADGELKVKAFEDGSSGYDHDGDCNGDRKSGDEDDDEDIEHDEDTLCGQNEDQEERDNMMLFDPTATTVLELGSGCGLLGIVMAELCQSLLLTDQKPVLPLLLKNLRKNLDKKYFDQDLLIASTGSSSVSVRSPSTSAAARKGRKDRVTEDPNEAKPCLIQVQELVWGQDLDQDLKQGLGVDYVVATDVVYNESIVPKLVYTLKELCEIREQVRSECEQGHGEHFDRLQEALFERSSDQVGADDHTAAESTMRKRRAIRMRRMERTMVLLAQELRTDYVHLAFLERLEQAGFQMVRVPKHMMDEDYQSGYVIYAFFLKNGSSGTLAN
ncbi:hypothetical protein EDD11_003350 [Mortierella claussenii]|nr:hypothetical protein EDD11_003350 [Mortierella claussenii]